MRPEGLGRGRARLGAGWLLACAGVVACAGGGDPAPDDGGEETSPYPETYRPQLHFTPEDSWMNDPNGLVWFDDEYHLFYQYAPGSMIFGEIHWGHAVSTDLLRWEHLPVVLEPDPDLGYPFSGSAVIDASNASGLCEAPCILLVFTHSKSGDQVQSLAYSHDRGRSFTLFGGNPVVPNPGKPDFRDPKVFWHEPSARWVMVVAAGREVDLYASPDLVTWTELSSFGPAGASAGVWECPDLLALPANGETRWVMKIDVNPGPFLPGSAPLYWLGSFDGERFTTEWSEPARVDHGADFYAAQSWSNAPGDGRHLWLAWMSNWQYALVTPTDPWRGAMTLPREVRLTLEGEGHVLVQRPVPGLVAMRQGLLAAAYAGSWRGIHPALDGVEAARADILLTVDPGGAAEVRLEVRVGEGEATAIGWDATEEVLFVDRTDAGEDDFLEAFAARHEAPLTLGSSSLELRIIVDDSSVEVFAQGGRVVLTDLIFPAPESTGLVLTATGGEATLRALEVWRLRSVWTD